MRKYSINKRFIFILLLGVSIIVTACGSDDEEPTTSTDAAGEVAGTEADTSELIAAQQMGGTNVGSGVTFISLQEGDGTKPAEGQLVKVHYTGKLADGTIFDSSVNTIPYVFQLGAGQVIPGWDQGIAELSKGGKAKLIVPPELAYGAGGTQDGIIPPNATLIFDVELVDVFDKAPDSPTEVDEADFEETDSGLQFYDIEVGDGASPEAESIVNVHYTGWFEDGTKFDSSIDRGTPYAFVLGQGRVIEGWDEGVLDMNIGGKRQLRIPPELAYGEAGFAGSIPQNATLTYEIELLSIE